MFAYQMASQVGKPLSAPFVLKPEPKVEDLLTQQRYLQEQLVAAEKTVTSLKNRIVAIDLHIYNIKATAAADVQALLRNVPQNPVAFRGDLDPETNAIRVTNLGVDMVGGVPPSGEIKPCTWGAWPSELEPIVFKDLDAATVVVLDGNKVEVRPTEASLAQYGAHLRHLAELARPPTPPSTSARHTAPLVDEPEREWPERKPALATAIEIAKWPKAEPTANDEAAVPKTEEEAMALAEAMAKADADAETMSARLLESALRRRAQRFGHNYVSEFSA